MTEIVERLRECKALAKLIAMGDAKAAVDLCKRVDAAVGVLDEAIAKRDALAKLCGASIRSYLVMIKGSKDLKAADIYIDAIDAALAPLLCADCPPAGYPTDKTRCSSCPRMAEKHGS